MECPGRRQILRLKARGRGMGRMWRRAGAVGDLRDRAARHAEARRRHGGARPPVRWLARTLGGGRALSR